MTCWWGPSLFFSYCSLMRLACEVSYRFRVTGYKIVLSHTLRNPSHNAQWRHRKNDRWKFHARNTAAEKWWYGRRGPQHVLIPWRHVPRPWNYRIHSDGRREYSWASPVHRDFLGFPPEFAGLHSISQVVPKPPGLWCISEWPEGGLGYGQPQRR